MPKLDTPQTDILEEQFHYERPDSSGKVRALFKLCRKLEADNQALRAQVGELRAALEAIIYATYDGVRLPQSLCVQATAALSRATGKE